MKIELNKAICMCMAIVTITNQRGGLEKNLIVKKNVLAV